jgi:hypothetical protein
MPALLNTVLLHLSVGSKQSSFLAALHWKLRLTWDELAIVTAIRLCVLCTTLSATRAGYKRLIFTATTTKPIVERMKQYPFFDRGLLQSQTVTLI